MADTNNESLWELLSNGEIKEVPSTLTEEQQAYYKALADEEAKHCPNPNCICRVDKPTETE